ncbi:Cilia- and flagella-associated protein 20, partial [Bienertia sinuspersici]
LPIVISSALLMNLYSLMSLTSHDLQTQLQHSAVTRVKPYICTMPLKLDERWNQIQLKLADFTK